MTEIPLLYQQLSSSPLHPPPAREDAQTCYAQLSASEMGILAFARLMDDASGNAVAEAPPFWLEPTAPLTTISPKPAYATTGAWSKEAMTTTTVNSATHWTAQQALDWTMAPHSPTPSLSSFASALSPPSSSSSPHTPDGFNIGFDLSSECMMYQATLFDNSAAPFGLVDPLCCPSINAICPTYSPPRQGHVPPTIPSIYPSHEAAQRQPASGVHRTCKKTRSQTSGRYDGATSRRRQHIAKHQRPSFPDERGKPFTRANRQPFATPAANHPGAQPGDLSAPPLGDPFGSWTNQYGVSPPQSTLEGKPTNQIISSQWVESGTSTAPALIHQNKRSGNPSTKRARKATNVTDQQEIIISSPRNGPGCHGNPIPDGLTFMEDNFINFQSPPEPTNGEPYTCNGGKNTVEFIWMGAKGKTRKL